MINTTYFSDLKRNDLSREEAGEVCVANISLLERQKRLIFGIRQFIFTLIILGILIALHVNPLWRLPLLFMFWAAAVGYFQARDKT
jgi:pilus assembly protein TadC